MMRKAPVAIVALVVWLAGATAASASTPSILHFSTVDQLGPEVAADLPCLEGKEFTLTGSVSIRATDVVAEDFFHFSVIQRFSVTLVPVDAQGPTYVESGNVDHISSTGRLDKAFVDTHVISDRFLGYVDGKLVASATLRIHELQHIVAVDTDGDFIPDVFKVSVSIGDVSCPA